MITVNFDSIWDKRPRVELKKRDQAIPMVVFADESSHTQKHFAAVGAMYARPTTKDSLAISEARLQAIKDKYGFKQSRIKWEKVPSKTSAKVFNAYLEFIEYFFKENFDFYIVVQDTAIHPLRHHAINDGKIEIGLAKLYYQLFRSLLRGDCAGETIKRVDKFYLDVLIDDENMGERVDLDTIKECMAQSAKRDFGLDNTYELLKFTPTNLRSSNLLQLADLLLGAGAAKWNNGISSEGKKRIINEIESRIKRPLTKETWKTDTKYLVWHHKPKPKKTIHDVISFEV